MQNYLCSVICLWLEENISSPVRYSFLSIFPDDKADIFAASLLLVIFYSLVFSGITNMVLVFRFFNKILSEK